MDGLRSLLFDTGTGGSRERAVDAHRFEAHRVDAHQVDAHQVDGPVRRSLRRDTSGAIMLMGIFMAVFLVGMLYYMVGIGESIAFRERMQDAADAGAFSAAVMNARGMNLIVLLNIIMAVAMAILIALKIVQVLLAIGTIIATALCFFPGVGCAALPTLGQMNTQLNRVIQQVERAVKRVTVVCSQIQNAIRLAWPALGQARAVDTMSATDTYSPPSTFGFVWPPWGALPVEDHEVREICDRASVMVAELMAAPFRILPFGDKIGDAVSGAIGGMVRALAVYFCGARPGESVDPPSVEVENQVGYPESDVQQACAQNCINPDGTVVSYPGCSPCSSDRDSAACQSARESVCDDYRDQLRVVGIFECMDGTACEENRDFEARGPCADKAEIPGESAPGTTYTIPSLDSGQLNDCQNNATDAASQCNRSRDRDLENFSYTEENRYLMYYKVEPGDGTCEVRSETVERSETNWQLLEQNNRRGASNILICQREGWGPRLGPWRAACQYEVPDGDCPGALPTCLLNENCTSLPDRDRALERMRTSATPSNVEDFTRRVRIVYEISNCTKTSTDTVSMELGEPATNTSCTGGEWGCPDQVCRWRSRGFPRTACPRNESSGDGDLYLGDGDFQLRAIAYANDLPGTGEAGVRIATWAENPDEAEGGVMQAFRTLAETMSHFSLAQAEFYWNQDEGWRDGPLERGLYCCERSGEADKARIEWMWDMAWRARLRRVSFGDADAGSVADSCSEAGGSGGACGGSGGFSAFLGNLISH
ncbi:MAG TPA: hypothetical protein RMH85_09145 [Polyangiaceae bacterium LLY-WYZ-15_(1-7)]|nr:hypothetical protein [Polyangiaceae bacterium LLY-WYZ-15_(1-7)]HJL08651.1 hypothetical protein [Polyangiaceae bacterium LLY-WYZ-15_(1-7)]HJL23355.1 hypothetical protein [Polyangiaceae bacterium LLY-WYZ-15_(1-7)]HJL33083.1 hypothetical protein [Polyangiaceae bacterium LLY-WYZ-15_(1-7)]HJL37892.1 hypothetical protein [Polyangiaceae bacterium LLY-WYZ-15_(1-7)]